MSTEELFDNDYFTIVGTVSDKDTIIDTIEKCGGIFSKVANKKTTLVICNDIDDENNKKELEKIKSDKIKIIIEDFVIKSFTNEKRLDVEEFISKSNIVPITTKSSSVLGKKKKRDDDDDDNGNDGQQDEENKKKKLKLEQNKIIEEGKQWMGSLYYPANSDAYPFSCNILKRVDNNDGTSKVEGQFKWLNLGNAETAFTMDIDGDSIKINEHTLITTDNDQVQIPNKYEAKISTQSNKVQIKGSIVYDDPEEQNDESLKNIFSLSLLGPIPSLSSNNNSSNNNNNNNNNTASNVDSDHDDHVIPSSTTTAATAVVPLDLDYLVDGAQFDGEFEIPYKFNMKVTGRKNEKDIEGNIEWVDLKTKTKFKGTLEKDNTVTITENEIISGDGIELPIVYKGKLQSLTNDQDMNLIVGNYSVNSNPTGTFKLSLQL